MVDQSLGSPASEITRSGDPLGEMVPHIPVCEIIASVEAYLTQGESRSRRQ